MDRESSLTLTLNRGEAWTNPARLGNTFWITVGAVIVPMWLADRRYHATLRPPPGRIAT